MACRWYESDRAVIEDRLMQAWAQPTFVPAEEQRYWAEREAQHQAEQEHELMTGSYRHS